MRARGVVPSERKKTGSAGAAAGTALGDICVPNALASAKLSRVTRLAVTCLTAAAAALSAAPAHASLRVEKTVTVRPAPHGGVQPGGVFEPGQSIQEADVALPRSVADCDWRLTDPRTGRLPGDP